MDEGDSGYLSFDEETASYKNVQYKNEFINIENIQDETGVVQSVNIFLRLPVYDLEGVKRGLKE